MSFPEASPEPPDAAAVPSGIPAIPPPLDTPPRMSEISRLANVFVSPAVAFADIARRPSWWVPIVLSVLVSLVYVSAYSNRVGWEQVIQKQLDQSPRGQNMTPAQRQAAIQVAERIAPITAFVGVAVGPLLLVFILAAVLMFLFDNIMGSSIGLQRMMAVVSYAQLPRVIVTALSMLVMYLKSPEDFDIRNPLVFNAAALLPADSPQWQRTLGGSFDVFTFWILALTALGISAAAPRIKFGKALGGVLFPWALYLILATGWAAAMA